MTVQSDICQTCPETKLLVFSQERPSQGFWGFREKGYLFSGIWGEESFIFRDLGRFWGFREQGAEGKHFWELGRKVIFLSGSREQRPPLGGPHKTSHLSYLAGNSENMLT